MVKRRRARNQRAQVKYLMLKELKKMPSLLLAIRLLRMLLNLTNHSFKLSLLEM
jgi:hypothetical protein